VIFLTCSADFSSVCQWTHFWTSSHLSGQLMRQNFFFVRHVWSSDQLLYLPNILGTGISQNLTARLSNQNVILNSINYNKIFILNIWKKWLPNSWQVRTGMNRNELFNTDGGRLVDNSRITIDKNQYSGYGSGGSVGFLAHGSGSWYFTRIRFRILVLFATQC
jgi:hypothetical protein